MALDFGSLDEALSLARRLAGLAGLFKINTQLFTAAGPEAVKRLAALGPEIFLDLKFHDIPNTVAGAIAAAAQLPGVRLVNVHTSGGLAMMRAAADSLAKSVPKPRRLKLLGVTILTSLDASALRAVGIAGPPGSRVVKLARLAQSAGLDGVVASPQEVRAIRRATGRGFLIVVPGIRPAESGESKRQDDQARVATPSEAIRAGADYLVVGRPIVSAKDPRKAAEAIIEEIATAMRSR